jgi:tetratricopeptide (TPR) repeat protein
LKKTFILLLLLSSILFSQNFLIVDSLDKKLIDLTFNDEYEKVKNICDSLIKLDSKNPRYYFHYFSADALQLHEKINQSPLGERGTMRELLVDSSIAKLEETIDLLDDIETTPINRFYIASLHGYYSRYAGLNRSWWAAYVNGKKANGMFEELIKEFPECYDAYLYPGVFSYYADRISGFTGFIASILGVSGDRAEGLNYINIALKNGEMVYPQALLMTLEINTMMEDNPYNAIPSFENFIKAYPKNKRVLNWYGHILLNLNSAKKHGVVINNDSLKVVDQFTKAKYYFLTEQLDSSAKYAKCAFQNPNTWRGIIEHTKYYCVYTNWLKGNVEAVKTDTSELNNRYASQFNLDLNNETESKYIYKLTTLLARENYSQFKKLSLEKPDFIELYFEAEFNLLQGIFLFHQNKLSESIPYFELAENSTDRRKKRTALRYLLDIYLSIDTPSDIIEHFIERAEETEYSKLIFRLDDLREKYNL